MAAEFELRPGLVIHKWAGAKILGPPPNHLRFMIVDDAGNAPELTRDDLGLLMRWFTSEILHPHKES